MKYLKRFNESDEVEKISFNDVSPKIILACEDILVDLVDQDYLVECKALKTKFNGTMRWFLVIRIEKDKKVTLAALKKRAPSLFTKNDSVNSDYYEQLSGFLASKHINIFKEQATDEELIVYHDTIQSTEIKYYFLVDDNFYI